MGIFRLDLRKAALIRGDIIFFLWGKRQICLILANDVQSEVKRQWDILFGRMFKKEFLFRENL